MGNFVSRAGDKLEHAFSNFSLDVSNKIVADFGSSTGGFVDCLLSHGATKVYSVDTSYGELAWKLRNNPKVVVLERTNAMHVNLPEKVNFISVDTSWTKQRLVLTNVLQNLKDDGEVVTLVKPHYEADKNHLSKGKLMDKYLDEVLDKVRNDIENSGFMIVDSVESPILGEKGKNREFLFWLKKQN